MLVSLLIVYKYARALAPISVHVSRTLLLACMHRKERQLRLLSEREAHSWLDTMSGIHAFSQLDGESGQTRWLEGPSRRWHVLVRS